MWLTQKIEEIRRRPEEIKLRYVWGSVIISMFFIVIIWLLSIMTLFDKESFEKNSPDLSPIKEQLQDFKKSTPSIQDIQNVKNNLDKINEEAVPEEIKKAQNNSNSDLSAPPFEISE